MSRSTLYSKKLLGYAQLAGNGLICVLITYLLVEFYDPCLILYLVPVLSYSNADTQKQLILVESKERAGIYL